MTTESQLREIYTEILTKIKDVSSNWVSGKGYPIIKMIANSGLLLNGKYTKNFIDNLVKDDIIEIQRENKDYIYKWSNKYSIEESVEKMLSHIFVDQEFKKGNFVFIMYNNCIHEGKIVESNSESVIVAVKTPDGLKSMTLNQVGLKSLSASHSLNEILNKLKASIRKY